MTFDADELSSNSGHGLEIAVRGFKGDTGKQPVQLFLEYYEGKLILHVWTDKPEDPQTIVFIDDREPTQAEPDYNSPSLKERLELSKGEDKG